MLSLCRVHKVEVQVSALESRKARWQGNTVCFVASAPEPRTDDEAGRMGVVRRRIRSSFSSGGGVTAGGSTGELPPAAFEAGERPLVHFSDARKRADIFCII